MSTMLSKECLLLVKLAASTHCGTSGILTAESQTIIPKEAHRISWWQLYYSCLDQEQLRQSPMSCQTDVLDKLALLRRLPVHPEI